MNDAMPIYLRAHTEFESPAEQWKGHRRNLEKYPEYALVFDCETTTDSTNQSLTFGAYQVCQRDLGGKYVCIEEGMFFADEATKSDRVLLRDYARANKAHVKAGNPARLRTMSRSRFVENILFKFASEHAFICGFNLPFDLSRIAVDARAARGNKGWSLIVSQYHDKNTGTLKENPFRSRIIVVPKDSKAAFIHLAGKKDGTHKKGRFLDLRTFLWALRNESHSLEGGCAAYGLKGKRRHVISGRITRAEIQYCLDDARATTRLLNAALEEFRKHPIDLLPERAISPASIGKSYLLQMGVEPPMGKFSVYPAILGIAMQAYFGGRAECRIRHTPVPVALVDFTSQYPTVNALMGLWKFLIAESLQFEDATDDIQKMCDAITLEKMFEPERWKDLTWFALIRPHKDMLPVRTTYDPESYNIGLNYLISEKPIWFAGPDIVASILQTGQVPEIIRAIRIIPQGQQKHLKPITFGGEVQVDPRRQDFFRAVIEARAQAKSLNQHSLAYFLKILANATSYGLFVEVNPERVRGRENVQVFSGEDAYSCSTPVVERRGRWYFPPLASLITAAGRLLLSMLEMAVTEAGGTYLFADTDSMGIVASRDGGLVPCKGGPHRLSNGMDAVRALSFAGVRKIVRRFERLNPYNKRLVPQVLKIEKMEAGLCGYAISTKRYALYSRTQNGVQIEKASEHGLGYMYPPKPQFNKKVNAPQWIVEFWEYLLCAAESHPGKAPSFFKNPAMMRFAVTTPNVLKPLRRLEHDLPYHRRTKPYGFMLSPILNRFLLATRSDAMTLITSFTKDMSELHKQKYVNIHNGEIFDAPPVPVETFADIFRDFSVHRENKSRGPDGEPCDFRTAGLLKRTTVNAGWIICHGKETDRKWEHGEDISLLFPLLPEYLPNETKKKASDPGLQHKACRVSKRALAREAKVSTRTVNAARRGRRLRKATIRKLNEAIGRMEEARKTETSSR